MGALWLAVGSILDKCSGLVVGHGQNNELGGYLFAQKWMTMGIPWLHMFLKVVTCGDLTGYIFIDTRMECNCAISKVISLLVSHLNVHKFSITLTNSTLSDPKLGN